MNIRELLTKRNIISFLIIAVLLLAIPFSLKLIQQRQNIKSKATSDPISFATGGSTGVTCDGSGNCTTTNTTVQVELRAPAPPY